MNENLQLKCFLVALNIISTVSVTSAEPRHRRDVADQPLLLTPLIEKGDVQNAQDLCLVKPLLGDMTSYAGFFTVNKTYNSNMFFWFFPASNGDEAAPVILWLMGGPGDSSLISLFKENGPYIIKEDLSLELREPSWTKNHSVIYIDNPVGTGFSFTEDNRGYSTNEADIGSNLYSALVQFFTLFPKYQRNDFFVAGESYGGKFVSAVSHAIHVNNPSAKVKINLKGLVVGNGAVDPESMANHGEYLYQIGLVNSEGKELFYKVEQEFVRLVQNQNWVKAFFLFDQAFLGNTEPKTLFRNLTGYNFIYNYLYTNDYKDFDIISRFFSKSNYSKSIHVGNATFNNTSGMVSKYILQDFSQSVKPQFEELLENYRVLLYNGQLDLLVPYPMTERFVSFMNWSGAAEFNAAPRTQWFVGKNLAGYAKEGGNLNLVLVRNAGHSAPLDQPEWCLDMITRFTRKQSFFLPEL